MTEINEEIRLAVLRGRADERQRRIIKLLEHMPRTDDDRTVDAPTLIALIKGEK